MKKKRNKRYVRRYFNSNPIDGLLYRKQMLCDEQMTTLSIHALLHLSQMKTAPNEDSFYNLSSLANATQLAVANGFDQGIPELNKAIAGLNRAHKRIKTCGSYALDGETLNALHAVIELREKQLRMIPRETILKLIQLQRDQLSA